MPTPVSLVVFRGSEPITEVIHLKILQRGRFREIRQSWMIMMIVMIIMTTMVTMITMIMMMIPTRKKNRKMRC
jgi:type IV secretory pathway component VirB8